MVEIFSEELNEEFLSSLKKELSETFSGCKKIAVKIHFGEPGNEKSLIPDKVKPFIYILKELGYEIFLYDSLVAYNSVRNDPVKHREHALSKGYGELCEIRANDEFILKKGKYMDY